MQSANDFARQHRRALTLLGAALVPLIAWADVVTGVGIRLSVLYLVPVTLLAWLWGARAGAAASLASAGFLLFIEARSLSSGDGYEEVIVNAGLRGLTLLLFAVLVARTVADRAELAHRVSERTQELAASEARWRFAIEGRGDGLWDWSIPARKVFYSPMWKEMLGYAEHEIGDGIDEFSSRLHPEDRERAEAAIKDFIDGKIRFYSSEFRLRCRDGSWKWILDRGATIEHDPSGRPLRAIGTHTDVSARKAMEQDLGLFKAMVDASSEAIVVTDPEYRAVFINKAHEKLWGRTLAEAKNRDARDYFTDTAAEALASRVLPAMARGESCEIELDAKDARGRTFPLWFRADPLRDSQGRPHRIFVVMHDLTESRRAEADLRISEERYRTVVNALHEGIVVQGADGRIQAANPAAQRILGLSLEQMRGLTSRDPRWEAIHEDGSPFPGETHPIVVTARTGEPQSSVIMGVRRSDADLAWLLANACPLNLADGTRGAVASFADITALRATEERLRASLREKQTLLMEVHHRVKNNLQVIASLLRLESGRAAQTATRAVLRDMQTRISAMSLLHETLYRSESFVSLDLSQYLRQLATQLFRSQVQDASIRLRLEVDDRAHPVTVDQAVTCGLLVAELMTNTIKHAFPEGRGGEVRVDLVSTQGDGIRLTVSDDGVGLPADLAERQANSLGLLLANDLARQLGGSLQTTSERGASFSVSFSPKPVPVAA